MRCIGSLIGAKSPENTSWLEKYAPAKSVTVNPMTPSRSAH